MNPRVSDFFILGYPPLHCWNRTCLAHSTLNGLSIIDCAVSDHSASSQSWSRCSNAPSHWSTSEYAPICNWLCVTITVYQTVSVRACSNKTIIDRGVVATAVFVIDGIFSNIIIFSGFTKTWSGLKCKIHRLL